VAGASEGSAGSGSTDWKGDDGPLIAVGGAAV
jgi:hypothetical protein